MADRGFHAPSAFRNFWHVLSAERFIAHQAAPGGVKIEAAIFKTDFVEIFQAVDDPEEMFFGIARVPLPTYPTWMLSIPELFAHLPSLVVHLSPGMSVKNVIEGQQKKVGLEKMKIMDGKKR